MHLLDSPFTRRLFFYTFIANIFALAFANALTSDSEEVLGDQMSHLSFDKIAH